MSYYLPTVLISSVGLTSSTARLLTACNRNHLLNLLLHRHNSDRTLRPSRPHALSGSSQFVSFLVITILLRFAETDTDEVYGAALVAFLVVPEQRHICGASQL
ncbi:hypothetical protein BDW66DRAFT_131098 [Aspergillus desertorum]